LMMYLLECHPTHLLRMHCLTFTSCSRKQDHLYTSLMRLLASWKSMPDTHSSASTGPQQSGFSVWRESWPMQVMARKAVCLVSKGPVDGMVTYVSIIWQLGTLLKPSDQQKFCWYVWLN
jgi:hypothetical protein